MSSDYINSFILRSYSDNICSTIQFSDLIVYVELVFDQIKPGKLFTPVTNSQI